MLETGGTAKDAIDYLSWLLFPVLTGMVLHYYPGKLAKRRAGDAENLDLDRETEATQPVAQGVNASGPLSTDGGSKAECQRFIDSETMERPELLDTLKAIRTALNAGQHLGPVASAVAAPETTAAEAGASTTEDLTPGEVRPPDVAVPVRVIVEVPAPREDNNIELSDMRGRRPRKM
ncbi:hypothetical protein MGYG_00669 [Nannizzia gypsea CBS 118893]|uniref:Uncharacterized protein n=1 Tax=Arthroderma gypseum (strain ATCC MYA-4604 / CBS 118893) TaxID=535722 RepID=E5R127_ARTGP|nr:hypothetical protein MGYG_00669 [Nannizzia gypsea CBS 118893]EFQ97631.1 hypothetical protein MGYG_00669 [Nannizzia gypsea CBS 118893]